MFKDYYAALGVPPNSSAEQIRKAYKRMALLSHPDRANGLSDTMNNTSSNNNSTLHDQIGGPLGGTGASSMDFTGTCSTIGGGSFDGSQIPAFTEIKEAYDVLSDVARRYLYDLSYQQAVEQQRQLQLEAQRRQQERERLQRERELELAYRRERELELQQERELRERQRREKQERAAAMAAVEAPVSSTSSRSGSPSKAMNPNAAPPPLVPPPAPARFAMDPAGPPRPPRMKPIPNRKPEPGGTGSSTGTGSGETGAAAYGKRKPRKEAYPPRRAAPAGLKKGAASGSARGAAGIPTSPSPAPSVSSSGSSHSPTNTSTDRLPNVRKANTIHFSVDILDTTNARPSRGDKPCGYPLPSPEELGLPPDYFQKRAVRKAVQMFFSDVMPLANMENDGMH